MGTSGGTTSSATWPSWMKPYMKQALGASADLYGSPTTLNAPPMDAMAQQGLMQRYQMANAGANPVGPAAMQESAKTLSGAYLSPDSNPYLREVANRAVNEATGDVASRFAGSGRVGSGSYAGALSDAAIGARANIYGNAYNQERNRMQAAVATAPQAYGLGYADYGQMQDVGQTFQDEAQRQFDWPYERLNRFANVVYGNPAASPGTNTSKKFDWMAMLGGIASPNIGGMLGGK